jgi:hypothetical protein
MANFKAEIAEALFDSSVKVSKDALLWAMSNLPDSKNHGAHIKSVKPEFDHEQENVFEACGLSEERTQQLASLMVKHLRRITEDDVRVSNIIEGVLSEIEKTPDLILLLVVKSVQDALAQASEKSPGDLQTMLKMLKMFKKMKGDEDLDV